MVSRPIPLNGYRRIHKKIKKCIFELFFSLVALQCMGRNPSGKAIERYWYQCGGKMSFQQFSVVMKKEARVTMGDLMNCFRRVDSTGDGTVSSQDLMALLTKVKLNAKVAKTLCSL